MKSIEQVDVLVESNDGVDREMMVPVKVEDIREKERSLRRRLQYQIVLGFGCLFVLMFEIPGPAVVQNLVWVASILMCTAFVFQGVVWGAYPGLNRVWPGPVKAEEYRLLMKKKVEAVGYVDGISEAIYERLEASGGLSRWEVSFFMNELEGALERKSVDEAKAALRMESYDHPCQRLE